ncbi:hypothetical protein PENPOL_c022G08118 [Penicillium polonicum]|uniref:Uncharacterized protein n=1 Tax=Penicillium polonicum TaxID=60169 RepID=A0A1V6N7N6_PENPO|nr:hypothetical protein PENPOL_c022G08118 [Penicillium polonicum]
MMPACSLSPLVSGGLWLRSLHLLRLWYVNLSYETWPLSIYLQASSFTANLSVAPQGNPGVDSDLLSIFGQVSRSEAMLMLQFLVARDREARN